MKGEKIMEIPVLEQAKKSLVRGELEEFDAKVKTMLADLKAADQKCTPTQLCSVLLKEVEFQRNKVVKLNEKLDEKTTENKKKSRFSKPEREEINIDFKKNPDAQRFFINIGEFDGINKSTLMDYISENVPSVSREDFSDSYTKDKFSFFELSKEKTDDVMANMNGLDHDGREVHVELSERRRDSRGGNRRDSRGYRDRHFSRGRDFESSAPYSRNGRPSFGDRNRNFDSSTRRFSENREGRSYRNSDERKPRYRDYSNDERYSKPKRNYEK